MNRRLTDQLRGIRQYDVRFADPMQFLPGPSHANVCVVESDVAGEPQPGFAGQLLVVFVQLADGPDEGTSLTNAAGHLICLHGPKWLAGEGYALDEGRRRVRYFECYPDADGGTVDEVWIEERSAAVRWKPFAPGTRGLSAFEARIGCSLPAYYGAEIV